MHFYLCAHKQLTARQPWRQVTVYPPGRCSSNSESFHAQALWTCTQCPLQMCSTLGPSRRLRAKFSAFGFSTEAAKWGTNYEGGCPSNELTHLWALKTWKDSKNRRPLLALVSNRQWPHITLRRAVCFPRLALAPYYHIKGKWQANSSTCSLAEVGGKLGVCCRNFSIPQLHVFTPPSCHFEFAAWKEPQNTKQTWAELVDCHLVLI